MNVAVEAVNLSKAYGATWAIRNCTLQLPQGRVIALVGPNGAGKSTLMSLIVGLTDPTSGQVSIAGRLLAGSEEALAEVSYFAQDHPLYKRFSVQDLLQLGRSLNREFDDSFARRRLSDLGIPLGRRAGKLSGGQQAQVALTLALAKRASILLLDEPVASLDPLARRDFMALLMSTVAERGTTVLLSSHVVAELERVCDYLVVLARSEVQVAGDVDDLLVSHKRLVGPAAAKGLPPDVLGIVETTTGRQRSIVARVSGAPLDPAWESHALSLEDVALAYLGAPDMGCLPRPELSAVPGGTQ